MLYCRTMLHDITNQLDKLYQELFEVGGGMFPLRGESVLSSDGLVFVAELQKQAYTPVFHEKTPELQLTHNVPHS